MVDLAGRKRYVRRQQLECFEKGRVEMVAMRAPLYAFEVAPELSRPLDRPHPLIP